LQIPFTGIKTTFKNQYKKAVQSTIFSSVVRSLDGVTIKLNGSIYILISGFWPNRVYTALLALTLLCSFFGRVMWILARMGPELNSKITVLLLIYYKNSVTTVTVLP